MGQWRCDPGARQQRQAVVREARFAQIKKNVDWGNASDQTKQEKNTFTFDITANIPTGEGEATEALTGTYNYYVGDSDTAAGQVTFTNGKAQRTLPGGTTVRIDGLPAGTTFTVTEQGVGQDGWTVTDATSQEGVENTNTADGIVAANHPAGSQASLTFSNTYHANEVGLSTNTTLKVRKNLEGRDWRDTDEFTFEIDGLGNTAGTDVITPEPADTTITVNSQTPDHTASFGDITFTMRASTATASLRTTTPIPLRASTIGRFLPRGCYGDGQRYGQPGGFQRCHRTAHQR